MCSDLYMYIIRILRLIVTPTQFTKIDTVPIVMITIAIILKVDKTKSA